MGNQNRYTKIRDRIDSTVEEVKRNYQLNSGSSIYNRDNNADEITQYFDEIGGILKGEYSQKWKDRFSDANSLMSEARERFGEKVENDLENVLYSVGNHEYLNRNYLRSKSDRSDTADAYIKAFMPETNERNNYSTNSIENQTQYETEESDGSSYEQKEEALENTEEGERNMSSYEQEGEESSSIYLVPDGSEKENNYQQEPSVTKEKSEGQPKRNSKGIGNRVMDFAKRHAAGIIISGALLAGTIGGTMGYLNNYQNNSSEGKNEPVAEQRVDNKYDSTNGNKESSTQSENKSRSRESSRSEQSASKLERETEDASTPKSNQDKDSNTTDYSNDNKDHPNYEQIRNTALSYLAQPKFSNSNLMEQITGTDAELEMLDARTNTVYLSMPKESFSGEELHKLTDNPDAVEFNDYYKELSKEQLNSDKFFFSFPVDDFKVDPSSKIEIPYENATYSISLEGLNGFSSNEDVYGGPLRINAGSYDVPNHGAFVAKDGTKSLENLVSSLTYDGGSKEAKAQNLLDFVTEEIDYSQSEANSSRETLKRPNEVLMTGKSDCSGNVIAYASLLEQAGIDYRLIYFNNEDSRKGHISVAVEGDYPNVNGLNFEWNDKKYSIAETTANGFEIGNSFVNRNIDPENISFIQEPGEKSEVYNAKTGEKVSYNY